MGRLLAGRDLWTGRERSLAASDALEVVDRGSVVVLSVPHSGTWVPRAALDFLIATKDLLVDTDVATDVLYATALPNVSHVVTRVNPYVVNVNRAPRGRAKPVLPPRHLYGAPTHRRAPTVREDRSLRAQFYTPYHRALQQLLAAAVRRHGYAILIDGHSMNSSGGPLTKDPGEHRATFVLGDRHGTSAAPVISAACTAGLSVSGKRTGWTIARNKPYAGGWVVRAQGNPKRGIHALQLETSKSAYLNGEAYEPNEVTHKRLSPNPQRLKLVASAVAEAVRRAEEAVARLRRRSARSARI